MNKQQIEKLVTHLTGLIVSAVVDSNARYDYDRDIFNVLKNKPANTADENQVSLHSRLKLRKKRRKTSKLAKFFYSSYYVHIKINYITQLRFLLRNFSPQTLFLSFYFINFLSKSCANSLVFIKSKNYYPLTSLKKKLGKKSLKKVKKYFFRKKKLATKAVRKFLHKSYITRRIQYLKIKRVKIYLKNNKKYKNSKRFGLHIDQLKKKNSLIWLDKNRRRTPHTVGSLVTLLYSSSALTPTVLKDINPNGKLDFTNSWLWARYSSLLAYCYTKFYVNWTFLNLKSFLQFEESTVLLKIFYKKNLLRNFFTEKTKFFNWFTQLVYLKDPRHFITLIEDVLTNTFLKKHKRIFLTVVNILRNWFNLLKKKKKIKGFSLYFKGKLGKKGSVKKTKFFYKRGNIGLTTKTTRLNYRTYTITTMTGVIGAAINIFF